MRIAFNPLRKGCERVDGSAPERLDQPRRRFGNSRLSRTDLVMSPIKVKILVTEKAPMKAACRERVSVGEARAEGGTHLERGVEGGDGNDP